MTDQTVAARFQTSIVVLAYNGCDDLTRPCIESLLENTQPGSFELILVDNASSDATPDYFRRLASLYPFVRLCLNDTNKGYAGGNNDGIRLAQGRYIVLLNNDTLVPRGWLERLIRLFEEQSKVGLVGPVTNSAGNEQRIDLPSLNEKNYEEVAGAYIDRQQGVWFNTEKLGFFCVAMRREVPEKIGILDERFGIGMFEDDDYCFRAKKAGYQLAVVEDCFVYHKGSVSFKKLSTSAYVEIFNNNRSYFYEKHRLLWTYADIASALWTKICEDLALFEKLADSVEMVRIKARVEGMTNSLYQLREVEQTSAAVGGDAFIQVELAEKHRQLMEMSDWASSLKQDNEKLAVDTAAARAELMRMSEWATGLHREIEEMSCSRLYRIFRYLQRRGL